MTKVVKKITKKVVNNVTQKPLEPIELRDTISIGAGCFAGYRVDDLVILLARLTEAVESIAKNIGSLTAIKACEHKPNHLYKACSNCGISINVESVTKAILERARDTKPNSTR